jgi:hypothetical protein
MPMQPKLAAILGVFVLTACATQAPRAALNLSDTVKNANASALACAQAVYKSDGYAPLRNQLSLIIDEASLEQLAYDRDASDEEAAAIFATQPQVQLCRNAALIRVASVAPTIAALLARHYADEDTLLVRVIRRNMTWGKYLTSERAEYNRNLSAINAEVQRIDAGMRQGNTAELERRQRAFNALAQYYQNQQLSSLLTRPTVQNTACTSFGDTVNCQGTTQ